MRYREGALLFHRALAERLLLEVGRHTSVQLVVRCDVGPPEEDCIGVASAIATRDQEVYSSPPVIDGATADPEALPRTPIILDCRRVGNAVVESRFQRALRDRADVVLVATSEIALLGCRVILFTSNNAVLFEVVAEAFEELLSHVAYNGRALLLPARFLTRGLRGIQADFNLFTNPTTDQPLTGADLSRYCEQISRTWRFRDDLVSGISVLKWVHQFEPFDTVPEALILLDYLNRKGYLPKGEIVNKLVDRYRQLSDAAGTPLRLASVQNNGKSEAMLSYDLHDIADSPVMLRDELVRNNGINHLVCCDDVVGSGQTILECLFEGKGTVLEGTVEHWLAQGDRRITFLVAVASEQGIQAIEQDARCQGKISVNAATILKKHEGIFSNNLRHFESNERRETFRTVCSEIGQHLHPWAPLGWGDCQWCVVTNYNVPDCSLPILWAQGTTDFPWTPLFPRR